MESGFDVHLKRFLVAGDFENSITSPDAALQKLCDLARTFSGRSAAIYVVAKSVLVPVASSPDLKLFPARFKLDSDGKTSNKCIVSALESSSVFSRDLYVIPILSKEKLIAALVCECATSSQALSPYDKRNLEHLADVVQRVLAMESALAKIIRLAMEIVEESKK